MSHPSTLHLHRAWKCLLVVVLATACGGSIDDPGKPGPLAGFAGVDAVDSAGNGVVQPFSPQGSGYVRGTVLAPAAAGAGNDSLNTKPRIAGVVIRIYPIVGDPNVASPTLGALQSTVTTDANGQFQTPVIDGTQGWHAFTFAPPAGSGYQAVWARTQFWTGSATQPWWVTLPRLP